MAQLIKWQIQQAERGVPLAGGQTVQDELDRAEGGSGGSSGGGRNVVDNFEDLRKIIPEFERSSFQEILLSPAFSGNNANILSSGFQTQLINFFLQVEGATGISISDFTQLPGSADAIRLSADRKSLTRGSSGGSGGGSGGGGGGGGAAVDPFAAGKFALQKYDAILAAHGMTVQQAIAAWQADFDEAIANSNIDITNVGNQLAADTTNATLAGQRAADIATNQARLTSEATTRADLTQQILKSSIPTGTTLNLPGAGQVPTHNINIPDLLNQGLPSLPDQFAGLGDLFPKANVQPGTVAPIDASPFPDLPEVPALPF